MVVNNSKDFNELGSFRLKEHTVEQWAIYLFKIFCGDTSESNISAISKHEKSNILCVIVFYSEERHC